jgi:hypothetical protein
MRKRLIRFSLVGLSVAAALLFAAGHSNQESVKEPQVRVHLETDKGHYKLGEKIVVTYYVENVGSDIVYVPNRNGQMKNNQGWIDIEVLGPLQPYGQGTVLDLFGGRPADVAKWIRETWVPLRPGSFYGAKAELLFPPKVPGRYRVVGFLHSAEFTQTELNAIRQMNEAVFTGVTRSNETVITVKR